MAPALVNTRPCFSSGGTDFDPPFDMAADIAQRYINNSIILFIFMTDGGSSYPSRGIQRLRSLQSSYPNKFKYAGI